MNDFLGNRKGLKPAQKRAVSQVIGSLAMMAIVAAVGSAVVFQGLSGIQGFNNLITGFVTTKRDTAGENLIVEHVQFLSPGLGSCPGAPSTSYCATLWFRNIGSVDAKIKTIKILRTDTQPLVLNENVNMDVYVKNYAQSQQFTNLGALDLTQNYKISITTERGNSFRFLATSYNT